MKKSLVIVTALLLSTTAGAEHHGGAKAEVMAAQNAFNDAYATNDVETYFGFYADDATAWWYGERVDLAAYHEEWTALIAAGGGVRKNDMSDIQIQLLAGDTIAIVTSQIDNTFATPEGDAESAQAFETDVWRKADGEWKIVHLHFTVITPEE